MKNVSIFDGGFVTFPSVLKQQKSVVDVKGLLHKDFILSPARSRVGSVKNLTYNLGVGAGDVKVFKTPFISGSDITKYNGYNLSLVVKEDKIKLQVTERKKILLLDCWEISELTKTLAAKNQRCNFIDNEYVKSLITSGKLKVKFNVSKIKNHGTEWKVF